MNIICWKLNKKLDYEDDINDIHICVDYESIDNLRSDLLNEKLINGKPLDIETEKIIKLRCNDFPPNNPKHTDVGFEKFNEAYKSSIKVYESIIFEIDNLTTEILVNENNPENAIRIKLNNINLQSITAGIVTSKNMAYFYDNFLPINFDNGESKANSRIIFWAGKEGYILYH